MSQITAILDSIFQNNGGTTKQWRTANEILLTRTDEAKKYVAYMKNKIRDLNKNVQLLVLDFLDYTIDDGKMPLWTQVGSKDFLNSLVNLYKTRNDEEVQKKILFLIKKWGIKFQKYNTIIPNYSSTYDHLKSNGINFPRDMDSTYEKYLQGPGIKSGFGEGGAKKAKNDKISSKNKNYVQDIDVDLRTSSYEKKYKRLVNKLDDWTQQIQDANVYMDSAEGGDFNDELRGICNDLESGKKLLVDTIESGKLKDEKLMEISLNVQDDIETTLRRWEDVKNGRKPRPFQSSFFNKRDDDYNKNDNNDDNRNNNNQNQNQKQGGFDLLGFEDDFGGNNNNNNTNNANNANDLFAAFSSPQTQNQNQNQGNNFFDNMGNNNNNNNDFFGNNQNNSNQQNNNNFFGNNQNNPNQNNNNFFGNNQNNTNQNNNDFFGNNQNNANQSNNNNNFFGNNNNQNNNNSNDLFSQMFNNNSNNNNINLLQNNLNNAYSNNNNNQFGMNFTNINNNNTMNNQMNFGNNNNNNNNNFNNFGFNNNNMMNNNNNNFNLNTNNNNNKKTSNNDFVFNF